MAENGVSQRQLRVGEEIRHVLAKIFLEETFYEPELSGISITVAEVRVSPDLKNATAFVSPLGGNAPEGFLDALNTLAPQFARVLGSRIKTKFTPRLFFKMDNSFENAAKIEELLETI